METNTAVNFVISFRVSDSSPDVGFYSVCSEYVLLPFVNRRPALVYGRDEYNQAGNLNRDIERVLEESRRHHVTTEAEKWH